MRHGVTGLGGLPCRTSMEARQGLQAGVWSHDALPSCPGPVAQAGLRKSAADP